MRGSSPRTRATEAHVGAVKGVDGVAGRPPITISPTNMKRAWRSSSASCAGAEGVQALPRRRAGPERRRAADQLVLEVVLGLLDERSQQRPAVAEAPVERALADARLGRDVVHRHRVDAVLVHQTRRRAQDALAVAPRVGALALRQRGRRRAAAR